MNQAEHLANQERKALLMQRPVDFTYSFNGEERTVTGMVEEREDRIFLYQYHGKYIGLEFFISFSKQSESYKLLTVHQGDPETIVAGSS